MIETLDETIRLLLKTLRVGHRQKTIIFTSDNGSLHMLESPESPATQPPYQASRLSAEGDYEALCSLAGRRSNQGTTRVVLTISADAGATAGIDTAKPSPAESASVAALEVNPCPGRCAAFPGCRIRESTGAIRDSDWKLVEHFKTVRWNY
jgi:hypothetical protein